MLILLGCSVILISFEVVIIWEVLLIGGKREDSVSLLEELLEGQSDIGLVGCALHIFNGFLERGNCNLFVVVSILLVAVDPTKLLEDVATLIFFVLGHDELIHLDSLIINSLLLKQISNLIKKLRILDSQPDGL